MDNLLIWLVVEFQPLWKIWVSQLGWWHSKYAQIKHVPNDQRENHESPGRFGIRLGKTENQRISAVTAVMVDDQIIISITIKCWVYAKYYEIFTTISRLHQKKSLQSQRDDDASLQGFGLLPDSWATHPSQCWVTQKCTSHLLIRENHATYCHPSMVILGMIYYYKHGTKLIHMGLYDN